MEILDTSVKGLKLIVDDTKATYTMNGNELFMDGEWASGEAWINDTWYSYERVDGMVVFEDSEGVERFTFADSEDSWDAFAAQVLA
jgi:hypothetical protein